MLVFGVAARGAQWRCSPIPAEVGSAFRVSVSGGFVQSHYEVLGVAPDADVAAIKRAWHVKVLLLHPDKHVDAPEAVRAEALRETRQINDAWATLKDSDRRRRYDLELARLVDASGTTHARGYSARYRSRPTEARVPLVCRGCGTTQRIAADAERFVCSRCKAQSRLVACDKCSTRAPVLERWGKWACAGCGRVHRSDWGGGAKQIKCVRCKTSTEIVNGAPVFRCRGCRREYLRCDCGVYTSFFLLLLPRWRCQSCQKWNRRVVDPEADQARSIQRLLDARGIDAPGAAVALTGHIDPQLDGVARVGANGADGVIAVAGDQAAVWWRDGRRVATVSLRDYNACERDGRRITLRGGTGDLCILASTDDFAEGWITHMAGLGASTAPHDARSPGA